MLHVTLAEIFHQESAAIGGLRRQQQVNVVGHQAIGVHRAAELAGKIAKQREIERIIVLGEEAGATVVAALDDMDRHFGHGYARAARHRHSWDIRPGTDHATTWSVPHFFFALIDFGFAFSGNRPSFKNPLTPRVKGSMRRKASWELAISYLISFFMALSR